MATGSFAGSAAAFAKIGVAQSEDHGCVGDCPYPRAVRCRIRALALHFAALVEEILNPGARRVIGDEVELVPEPVEFLLALLVEDQFHQRRIVAEVAHHVVIARAQQPALVLGIVGK